MQISQELAQATINYLGTKPFGEVFQLIAAFQQAAQQEQTEEKQKDEIAKEVAYKINKEAKVPVAEEKPVEKKE